MTSKIDNKKYYVNKKKEADKKISAQKVLWRA